MGGGGSLWGRHTNAVYIILMHQVSLPLTFYFEMVYFRSYWSHLDISTIICQHQMAAVGFELTTLGFRGMAPAHCTIGADH